MSKTALRITDDHESRAVDTRLLADRVAFTKTAIDRLRAGASRRWVYDDGPGKVSGLAVQITPAGAKVFYWMGRINGVKRKRKLGRFPDISVEQARAVAKGLVGDIAKGIDPIEERRKARGTTTLGKLFIDYIEQHAKRHKRTWEEDQGQYDRHLKRWEGRRLEQIKRADVDALHAKISREAPVAANRLMALIGKVFAFAQSKGYDGPNPARGVTRNREQSRERWADADELPRLLDAIDAEPDESMRDYFWLLLLTGQRRRNVAAIKWDDIDFTRKVWTIPSEDFKTGASIEVPLIPQAVGILTARAKLEPDDPRAAYVFPSKRRKGKTPYLSEPKTAWRRVLTRAGVADLTIHDIRRTVASWATVAGVAYPVVARMVGHTPQGVTSIYARFGIAEVRAGFEKTLAAMLATREGQTTTSEMEPNR